MSIFTHTRTLSKYGQKEKKHMKLRQPFVEANTNIWLETFNLAKRKINKNRPKFSLKIFNGTTKLDENTWGRHNLFSKWKMNGICRRSSRRCVLTVTEHSLFCVANGWISANGTSNIPYHLSAISFHRRPLKSHLGEKFPRRKQHQQQQSVIRNAISFGNRWMLSTRSDSSNGERKAAESHHNPEIMEILTQFFEWRWKMCAKYWSFTKKSSAFNSSIDRTKMEFILNSWIQRSLFRV